MWLEEQLLLLQRGQLHNCYLLVSLAFSKTSFSSFSLRISLLFSGSRLRALLAVARKGFSIVDLMEVSSSSPTEESSPLFALRLRRLYSCSSSRSSAS